MLQVDLKLVVASLVRGQVHLPTADEECLTHDGVGDHRSGRAVMSEQEERAQSSANQDTNQQGNEGVT